jgi:hypothetical protein
MFCNRVILEGFFNVRKCHIDDVDPILSFCFFYQVGCIAVLIPSFHLAIPAFLVALFTTRSNVTPLVGVQCLILDCTFDDVEAKSGSSSLMLS